MMAIECSLHFVSQCQHASLMPSGPCKLEQSRELTDVVCLSDAKVGVVGLADIRV